VKKTVEAFEEAGLRNNFRIMISGVQINEGIRKYVKVPMRAARCSGSADAA
jgi:hypothetical protein